jgi:uncharacterized coiled-coil protein SlyX
MPDDDLIFNDGLEEEEDIASQVEEDMGGPIWKGGKDEEPEAEEPEPEEPKAHAPTAADYAAQRAYEERMAAIEERSLRSQELLAESMSVLKASASRPPQTAPPPQRHLTPEEQRELLESNPVGFVAQIVAPALQRKDVEVGERLKEIESRYAEQQAIIVQHDNSRFLNQAVQEAQGYMEQTLDKYGIPDNVRDEFRQAMAQRLSNHDDALRALDVDSRTRLVTGHRLNQVVDSVLGSMNDKLFQYGNEAMKSRTKGRMATAFPNNAMFQGQKQIDPMAQFRPPPSFSQQMKAYRKAAKKKSA